MHGGKCKVDLCSCIESKGHHRSGRIVRLAILLFHILISTSHVPTVLYYTSEMVSYGSTYIVLHRSRIQYRVG